MNEGFRTPGLLVPILGVLVSMVFVVSLDRWKLLAAAIAIGAGAIVYLLSRPRATEPIPQKISPAAQ